MRKTAREIFHVALPGRQETSRAARIGLRRPGAIVEKQTQRGASGSDPNLPPRKNISMTGAEWRHDRHEQVTHVLLGFPTPPKA